MDSTFFSKNDDDVTRLMCKILLWMTLIFPVFFLLSIVKVFSITVPALLRLLPFGLICTISPTILYKCKVKTTFLKNYSIIAVGVFIAIMATNSHVGIYMTYCLALAFSCLYFDRRFTIRTAIIGYVLLVVAVFFRSRNVEIYDGSTPMKWFIAYTMGYTMEYVAMSLVFINLAKRARKLLETLHNTEQVKDILTHCGDASTNLSELMINLKSSINDTVDNNSRIKNITIQTKSGCEHNLDQANQTSESIEKLDSNILEIAGQTQALTEITNSSYEKTRNYIDVMNKAVEAMEQIRQGSDSIQEQIAAVESCRNEISDFANTISSIAAKTNILALNASIEAARAGENGKSFAVVASQVGQLAEATKNATINIKQRIEAMNESVSNAHESVNQNAVTVESGLTEITSARDEAGALLDYQVRSNEKVAEVEGNLKANEACQNEVSVMSADMSEVTLESLNQVGEIQEALEAQAELTATMLEAFAQVQAISDQLLTISQQSVGSEE